MGGERGKRKGEETKKGKGGGGFLGEQGKTVRRMARRG